MCFRIEPIQETHVAGFHAAVDAVARERKYLPALEAPPLPSTRDFVLKNIADGQSQLVALQNDAVVGWCDILRRADAVRAHVGVVGMGLLPAVRARGLGRRLLTETLIHARRHGYLRIELKVRASNTRAITLYEKLGFVHEGTLRNDILLDGQLDSTLCMALFPEPSDQHL